MATPWGEIINAGLQTAGGAFNAWGSQSAQKQRDKRNSYNDPNSRNSEALLQQLLQGGAQGIQNTPLDFSKIRDSTMARYNSEVQPGLAQRFSSDLGGGASSGLFGTLFGGQAQLQQDLAAQEQGFNMDKYKLLLDQLQLGLGSRQLDTTPNWQQSFGSALSGAGPGIGNAVHAYQQGQQPKQSNFNNVFNRYNQQDQNRILKGIQGKYQLGPQA